MELVVELKTNLVCDNSKKKYQECAAYWVHYVFPRVFGAHPIHGVFPCFFGTKPYAGSIFGFLEHNLLLAVDLLTTSIDTPFSMLSLLCHYCVINLAWSISLLVSSILCSQFSHHVIPDHIYTYVSLWVGITSFDDMVGIE